MDVMVQLIGWMQKRKEKPQLEMTAEEKKQTYRNENRRLLIRNTTFEERKQAFQQAYAVTQVEYGCMDAVSLENMDRYINGFVELENVRESEIWRLNREMAAGFFRFKYKGNKKGEMAQLIFDGEPDVQIKEVLLDDGFYCMKNHHPTLEIWQKKVTKDSAKEVERLRGRIQKIGQNRIKNGYAALATIGIMQLDTLQSLPVNAAALCLIHKGLYQDICEDAGVFRTAKAVRNDREFSFLTVETEEDVSGQLIGERLNEIFHILKRLADMQTDCDLQNKAEGEKAKKMLEPDMVYITLARAMGDIWSIQPFSRGNLTTLLYYIFRYTEHGTEEENNRYTAVTLKRRTLLKFKKELIPALFFAGHMQQLLHGEMDSEEQEAEEDYSPVFLATILESAADDYAFENTVIKTEEKKQRLHFSEWKGMVDKERERQKAMFYQKYHMLMDKNEKKELGYPKEEIQWDYGEMVEHFTDEEGNICIRYEYGSFVYRENEGGIIYKKLI